MAGAAPTSHEIDTFLSRILERPEFYGLHPSWWEQLPRKASRVAQGWADSLGHIYELWSGPVVRWAASQPAWIAGLVAMLALLFFGGLLVYGVYRLRRRWVGDPRLSPHSAQMHETRKELATELSPRALRRRVTRAAHAGNAREAVRLLYDAALDHLASQGVIRLEPHSTNRDYLEEASTLSASRRASFAKVTSLYERVWYGRQFATAADIDYGIRCVTSLLE